MGMMKNIVNVGRKFRTAYMKSARRKTTAPKPLSEDWRARNRAGDHQARNEFKKHMADTNAYIDRRVAKRQADFDAGYPELKARKSKSKPSRITFKGQDMQERNFMKNYDIVGSYKYGTLVPKASLKRHGEARAVREAAAYKRTPDRGVVTAKWAKNYKTRSYQP